MLDDFLEIKEKAARVRVISPLKDRVIEQRTLSGKESTADYSAFVLRLENWRRFVRGGGSGRSQSVPGWVEQFIDIRDTDRNIGATSLRFDDGTRIDIADARKVECAVGSLLSSAERELLRCWYVWALPPEIIRRRVKVRAHQLPALRLRAENNLMEALAQDEERD